MLTTLCRTSRVSIGAQSFPGAVDGVGVMVQIVDKDGDYAVNTDTNVLFCEPPQVRRAFSGQICLSVCKGNKNVILAELGFENH